MAEKLTLGATLPRITLKLIDGSTLSLPEGRPEGYLVLMFYRGHWCTQCNRHLIGYQAKMDELRSLGVTVVAGSVDSLEDTRALAEALVLGRHAGNGHALNLDFEQQLDGSTHIGLARVAAHLEDHLITLLGKPRGLFGHVRTEQHLHQAFLIGLLAHLSFSSTLLSAPAVMMTLSAPTRLTGSMS